MNPNDEIRRQMLRYFYERNRNARGKYGKHGSAVKITDLKRALKEQHGLKQNEVISNLNYLLDRKWVNQIEIQKQVKPRGGTTLIPQTTTWYEVSAKGIDKIEGGSEFEPKEPFAGVNIHATGSNVITLGDGNVVNADYRDLHSELNDLKEDVSTSTQISESQKLEVVADIESLKSQLAKPTPSRNIIQALWTGIQAVATAGGAIAAVQRVQPLIEHLIR